MFENPNENLDGLRSKPDLPEFTRLNNQDIADHYLELLYAGEVIIKAINCKQRFINTFGDKGD